MKYIVIKSSIIDNLKIKFGEDVVKECLEISKTDHPKKIYESLKESDNQITPCFFEIFKELIV
jgi:hypothetical protein